MTNASMVRVDDESIHSNYEPRTELEMLLREYDNAVMEHAAAQKLYDDQQKDVAMKLQKVNDLQEKIETKLSDLKGTNPPRYSKWHAEKYELKIGAAVVET